jgi:hypothetical protein
MASYATIPATEDLGLTAAAPPKNTLGRKGLATLAALCFASGVAGYAAPSAARGLANFASSSSDYHQIRLPVKGDKWHKERTDMKYGKDAWCLAVEDHKTAGKGSALTVWPCQKNDASQLFQYVVKDNDQELGQIKYYNPVTKSHLCLDIKGGEDATTGSPIVLNSCKDDDDNQSFWYDETYNTFTIPMDPTGDDARYDDLCMGTTRSFDSKLKPGKYDLVGVNCEDGTSAEGDILFTMYPKYTLSY